MQIKTNPAVANLAQISIRVPRYSENVHGATHGTLATRVYHPVKEALGTVDASLQVSRVNKPKRENRAPVVGIPAEFNYTLTTPGANTNVTLNVFKKILENLQGFSW